MESVPVERAAAANEVLISSSFETITSGSQQSDSAPPPPPQQQMASDSCEELSSDSDGVLFVSQSVAPVPVADAPHANANRTSTAPVRLLSPAREAAAVSGDCELSLPQDTSLELLRVENEKQKQKEQQASASTSSMQQASASASASSMSTPRSHSRLSGGSTLAFQKRKFAHCPADRSTKDSPAAKSKSKERANRSSRSSAVSLERSTVVPKSDPFSAFR